MSMQLINLGKQLDWPEIFMFPEKREGCQLTMVLAGRENWYWYIANYGKEAVLMVTDRAQRLLIKQERETGNEKEGREHAC
jgi:hypothetical protein